MCPPTTSQYCLWGLGHLALISPTARREGEERQWNSYLLITWWPSVIVTVWWPQLEFLNLSSWQIRAYWPSLRSFLHLFKKCFQKQRWHESLIIVCTNKFELHKALTSLTVQQWGNVRKTLGSIKLVFHVKQNILFICIVVETFQCGRQTCKTIWWCSWSRVTVGVPTVF